MPDQDHFQLRVESESFAADQLFVASFEGTERISRLFEYRVLVVSPKHDGPKAEEMLGARVSLVIERDGVNGGWSGARRLSGVVAEVVDRLAGHADIRVYELRVVPRAHALALVETQDIFLGASVPDIVKSKLAAVNLAAASRWSLAGTYAPREFVVQYHESDLAFASRLTEHLGISFYFSQGDDGESIVFTDHIAGFLPIDDAKGAPYRSRGEGLDVFALEAKHAMVPGYYAVRDYNYRTPLVDITGEASIEDAFPGGVIEFGSHHKTPQEGAALASVRAEERRAGQLVYAGESHVPLTAGARFTVEDHPDLGTLALLVTEVDHAGGGVVAGVGAPAVVGYRNRFRAIPADRTFRPARVTPRPRIAGLVTGLIDPGGAPPDAKYAQIDAMGRYTVRFLFDTTPPGERAASRPVRMIQNHVGENYGTHFPLKPGIEVVIAFVDGDPDRPLIVGAVPNPTKPSPVTVQNSGTHRIRTSTGITLDLVE
jgi:type VI secretion system secreted protein VgrG